MPPGGRNSMSQHVSREAPENVPGSPCLVLQCLAVPTSTMLNIVQGAGLVGRLPSLKQNKAKPSWFAAPMRFP